jgi:hypothetical protein
MRDGCPCALLASMRPIRSDIHEAALKRHRDGSPAWVWLLGARNGVHAAGRRHASCAPARRDGRPCSDLSHELAFGARSGHPADGVGGRRGFVWPRPAVSARSDYETLRLRCEFGAVLLAEFRSNALKRGLTRDRTPEALTRSHTPSLQPSTSNRSRRPRMTRPHPSPATAARSSRRPGRTRPRTPRLHRRVVARWRRTRRRAQPRASAVTVALMAASRRVISPAVLEAASDVELRIFSEQGPPGTRVPVQIAVSPVCQIAARRRPPSLPPPLPTRGRPAESHVDPWLTRGKSRHAEDHEAEAEHDPRNGQPVAG